MKTTLTILTALILFSCNKKHEGPIKETSPFTNNLEVYYYPGGSNTELKVNLNYQTGLDSIYYSNTKQVVYKSFNINPDTICISGRSYDANFEIDSFVVKYNGNIVSAFGGKSQTRVIIL